MKKIAALSAVTLLATAGAAFGQDFRVDYRILVQEITGSGSTRSIANAADNQFNPGDTVRFTVQYMITDLRTAPPANQAFCYGWTGTSFNVVGTGGAGNGTLQRSQLTNSGTSAANGEVDAGNNSVNWPNGQQYPQTGTNAAQSGLHSPFRFGLNGIDTASSNGTIVGDDITAVVPLQTGGGAAVNQICGNWWGLYSFEFVSNPGFNGQVDFTLNGFPAAHQFLLSPTSPDDGGEGEASAVLHALGTGPGTYTQGPIPTATVTFGTSVDLPPVATEPNGDPVNVVANPGGPDAVNLVLASFTDPEGGNVDVAIISDGGLGLVGGTVSITGDNGANPMIVLNGEFNNAAIGQSFIVQYSGSDGVNDAVLGSVTVTIVPAPGAAALLGLGGLLAARRRRA